MHPSPQRKHKRPAVKLPVPWAILVAGAIHLQQHLQATHHPTQAGTSGVRRPATKFHLECGGIPVQCNLQEPAVVIRQRYQDPERPSQQPLLGCATTQRRIPHTIRRCILTSDCCCCIRSLKHVWPVQHRFHLDRKRSIEQLHTEVAAIGQHYQPCAERIVCVQLAGALRSGSR